MSFSARYWPVLVAGAFGICYLWRSGSLWWPASAVLAKASIQVDLTIPASSPILVSQRFFEKTAKRTKSSEKHRGAVSRYMLKLYNRRSDADMVRALQPVRISAPLCDGGGRILEFAVPSVVPGETLVAAELLGNAGMILRVRPVDGETTGTQRSRRDDAWRAFNVTGAVLTRSGDTVRLLVRGRIRGRERGEGPVLLLSYRKPRKRRARAVSEEEQKESNAPWEEEGVRRRHRNSCRRRPLYVDFAMIAYDEWVVAPPGYEAYQCAGKCFYPFGDHLSPTKHAIVQTLVHGALQGGNADSLNGKYVSRACCVPTRLAPTSLLYLDSSGTLTYQYGYEDMVVAECGCR